MNRLLIVRTKLAFILIIILSFVFTFFSTYMPMKSELELNILQNFKLLAETKTNTFNQVVEKSVQGSQSLSSRTMIRNKIVEYLDGDVSFEDLQNYTAEKYRDGVSVIENINFAQRVVNDQVVSTVCKYGNVSTRAKFTDNASASNLTILINDRDLSLKVISPISASDSIIGYDILRFSLKDIIGSLDGDTIHFHIADHLEPMDRIHQLENIYENEHSVYYISPLEDNKYVYVHTQKEDLYKSINRITLRSGILVSAGYLLMWAIVHFYILSAAESEIASISEERDNYRIHADTDKLTGAYSRLFLDNFQNECSNEPLFLILVDLNKFKEINDQYGHIVGDEVLKVFVSVFKNSIRNDDIVIRLGGDEFLIILNTDDIKMPEEVVQRVKLELSSQEDFEFDIDFSYGISKVVSTENIYESIEEADKRMYQNKKEGRNYA